MSNTSLNQKSIYKYITLVLSAAATLPAICLIYISFGSKLVNEIYSEPLYMYSILLFLFSLILVSFIIYKSKTFPPSIFLYFFFLGVPLIGSISHQIYLTFHDWIYLEFALPTFIWAIGTVSLLAGILFSYFVIPIPKCNYVIKWDSRRGSFLLWFTVLVSLFFTALAVIKIGYIPVLTSGIDQERLLYSKIVGEWTLKLSRLSVLAACISSMFVFLKRRGKIYLFITLLCGLVSFIYGQRLYLFLVSICFLLIYSRFRKIKLSHLIILGICMISFFPFYQASRGETLTHGHKLHYLFAKNLFGEWREYSTVVNQLRSDEHYKEKIFLGPLVALLPKQIWSALDVDKSSVLREYGAAWIFGRYFGQEGWGIRIGTIGEAYVGYGIRGVCLQMFIFGIIFGVLERIYFRLDKRDARLCLVCFLISLLLYLPLTTLVVTTTNVFYFGFFFILYQLIGTNQVTSWIRK